MRSDRRQETLRSWRARHGERSLETPLRPPAACAQRVRRRHRAPTPRLPRFCARRHVGRSVALPVLAGVLLSVLAVAVWRAPALHVTHGAVRGNQRHSAESIYVAARVDGRHMLAVDWRDAGGRVVALGGIRNARARPAWPGGATIVVEETALVLSWVSDGQQVVVDDAGGIEPALAPPDGLPRVTSTAGLPRDSDGRLPADLLAAATAYGARFGELGYDAATGITAVTPGGAVVRLGRDPAAAGRQMAALDALLAQLPGDASRGALVDLRFSLRPYMRVSEGAP
jgi:cell division septal protein FtsQ